jgi:hypothetical protein
MTQANAAERNKLLMGHLLVGVKDASGEDTAAAAQCENAN